eukprot:tig00000093_g3636.t1
MMGDFSWIPGVGSRSSWGRSDGLLDKVKSIDRAQPIAAQHLENAKEILLHQPLNPISWALNPALGSLYLAGAGVYEAGRSVTGGLYDRYKQWKEARAAEKAGLGAEDTRMSHLDSDIFMLNEDGSLTDEALAALGADGAIELEDGSVIFAENGELHRVHVDAEVQAADEGYTSYSAEGYSGAEETQAAEAESAESAEGYAFEAHSDGGLAYADGDLAGLCHAGHEPAALC